MTPTKRKELEKLLIITFGQMMIGKDYPNVGQLVEKAMPLFDSYLKEEVERANHPPAQQEKK